MHDTHRSAYTVQNAPTVYNVQGTVSPTNTQHATQTQGAMKRNQVNSSHAQQRAASPEPSTPTQNGPGHPVQKTKARRKWIQT